MFSLMLQVHENHAWHDAMELRFEAESVDASL